MQRTASARKTPRFDFLPEVSQSEAAALRQELQQRRFVPTTHHLRDEVVPNPDFITVIDQGREGISVGVALAAVLNYLRAEHGETRPVSARMLYEYARVYDEFPGNDYEGTSIVGGLAGLVRHGVCLESEWPLGGLRTVPADGALEAALQNRPAAIRHIDKDVDQVCAAVFEGHAVLVAATIHEGWQTLSGEVISMSSRGGHSQSVGVHAFAVVGYTSKGFVVQNSWGQSWGGVTLRDRSYPGLAIWPYEDAEANLVDAWFIQFERVAFHPPLVGYDADSLEGDDLLDIRTEVNAFSYVLASRTIKPPLALGLFGDWGSGKSFFMQEMHKKIDALVAGRSANGSPEAARTFCSRVVQIRFNAWHYLDTDLWASLVTEIFDKLFEAIGGGSGRPEEKLPRLKAELQAANGVYQQAKQQLDDANAARKAAEDQLTVAVAAREQKESTLLTQLNDIATLLVGDNDTKAAVDKLADDLALPELRSSYAALDATANEAKTLGRRSAVLLHAMFSTPWGVQRLLTLLVAVSAPLLIVLLIELARARWPGAIDQFHSFALQVSGLLAAVTAWLVTQVRRGAGILSKLEDTHHKLEKIRDKRREEFVSKDKAALQALKEKEDAARKALRESEERVQVLQREIADLQPGRLIMRFIEERSRSSDYRSRLGIVSLVRRDFQRLSELADTESDKGDAELMPVERIILYIDDLDRCRPERVIEVLEAVHLLLAFKLFMVVVAVDPRWLRRCLEKHYPDLLALRTQEVSAVAHVLPSRPATAQDYLEKIFQLPFALQSLKVDGYRRLVRGLTALNLVEDAAVPVAGNATMSAGGPPLPDTAGGAPSGPDEVAATEMNPPAELARKVADMDDDVDESAVKRLSIRSWELQDIEQLARMFRTPRAVKRFVNTYRFLRAGVRPHELNSFEGTRDEPGTYRPALALLAVVVSYSNVAPRMLRRIIDAKASGNGSQQWIQFLQAARADVGPAVAIPAKKSPARKSAATDGAPPRVPQNWEEIEWQQLCDALLSVSSVQFPVRTVGELAQWIRVVARYSFSLAATGTLER